MQWAFYNITNWILLTLALNGYFMKLTFIHTYLSWTCILQSPAGNMTSQIWLKKTWTCNISHLFQSRDCVCDLSGYALLHIQKVCVRWASVVYMWHWFFFPQLWLLVICAACNSYAYFSTAFQSAVHSHEKLWRRCKYVVKKSCTCTYHNYMCVCNI